MATPTSTTTAPPSGLQILGASYATVLARLARGQRKGTAGDIKPSQTHVTQLEGKVNWLLWRTYIAAPFSHHLESRLWYFIHDHPATSVEAYRLPSALPKTTSSSTSKMPRPTAEPT
ncbi:unnamed protein product [Tilletia controversa]|uniref:Uncharacterized protein n=1 Tax=Tilletia controversa TaxID=13291 RepID=A0A8X7MQJ4_9BASI|nr:hypothetical protein CF328_g6753 [Tilletia controversa]KAE8245526.1 hypothetical protein A4X06_0g5631 [Tilletia controversa]CAD6937221.1 unnamed protein product [Tilletia controversa]CAD6981532.1 unnamed protein product [Tilletia controversa]CAD6982879.1 unnamed protein product [Tilletia controversa]